MPSVIGSNRRGAHVRPSWPASVRTRAAREVLAPRSWQAAGLSCRELPTAAQMAVHMHDAFDVRRANPRERTRRLVTCTRTALNSLSADRSSGATCATSPPPPPPPRRPAAVAALGLRLHERARGRDPGVGSGRNWLGVYAPA